MTAIPGSIRVTGFIAPSDSTDTYYVTDPIYGKGGYREVPTATDRDLITTERRREGMMVYVQDVDKFYYLKNGITNSDWLEFTGGISGTVTVSNGGTGLTSIAAGLIPFGNDSTSLATSASLVWNDTDQELTLPKLILTDTALSIIKAGKFEFASGVLYFSPSTLVRSKVLLDTFAEAQNIVLGTVTGTQIGTAATQKLGFFGATPVTQRGIYALTNAAVRRTLNARDADLDELSDIVCTIIEDLKSLGLFS